ncbi:hypothetical protein QF026_001453 [Streptomyces aurantiacus]|uniref:hypothetical protein n=1 Tax=Streptomyces aurantiacus TaxID=47760 RepID=UPI00278F9252|nr:hypothetical protein [Streptomyces aurantiacus]MDQ0772987.1 hypothetical protein [Streptomyces aurantiacus]
MRWIVESDAVVPDKGRWCSGSCSASSRFGAPSVMATASWTTTRARSRQLLPALLGNALVRASVSPTRSAHLPDGLVDEDWGRRYGRPVRLGKNPTRPKTRILAASDDACQLSRADGGRRAGRRPAGGGPWRVRRLVCSTCGFRQTFRKQMPTVLERCQ